MQPRRGGRIVLTAQTADLRVYNTHAESGNNDALRVRQLLEHFGDAPAILSASKGQLLQVRGIGEETAGAIANWKWAAVPQYQGKHGHPILLAREMIEAFLRAAATATARDVEHQNAEHIEYVPIDDPLVIANINTPDEYASLNSGSPG